METLLSLFNLCLTRLYCLRSRSHWSAGGIFRTLPPIRLSFVAASRWPSALDRQSRPKWLHRPWVQQYLHWFGFRIICGLCRWFRPPLRCVSLPELLLVWRLCIWFIMDCNMSICLWSVCTVKSETVVAFINWLWWSFKSNGGGVVMDGTALWTVVFVSECVSSKLGGWICWKAWATPSVTRFMTSSRLRVSSMVNAPVHLRDFMCQS